MNGLLDYWIIGLMDEWRMAFAINPTMSVEYTKRRNLNRGYMKLEVWQRGMDLFGMAFRLAGSVADIKLKSQFTDAAQSVSANIAEGYGRRTLPRVWAEVAESSERGASERQSVERADSPLKK